MFCQDPRTLSIRDFVDVVEAASRKERGFVYNPDAKYPKSVQRLEERYAKQMASNISASVRASDNADRHRLRYKRLDASTLHDMEKRLGELIRKAIVPSKPHYACRIRVSLIDQFWNVRIIDFIICSYT